MYSKAQDSSLAKRSVYVIYSVSNLQIAPDANPLPIKDVDLEIKSKILRPLEPMDVDTFINPVDADLECYSACYLNLRRRSVWEIVTFGPSVMWGLTIWSHKDANIANIISLIRLECPFAEAPKVSWLQPSYAQLLLPVHRKEDNVVTRETSLSDSLDVVHARVLKLKEVTVATTSALAILVTTANISSIPTISMADYDTPDAGVQDTAPYSPKIVFEKEDLETAPEHPSAS
uniref:Uncharacterized protein n=1 Tax=Tanacetum cinerariifolium TaxID=118510 RepID=A0A6L2K3A4_TANCI|nr:hypothetical protein [Tanacetum cinerariifolium]